MSVQPSPSQGCRVAADVKGKSCGRGGLTVKSGVSQGRFEVSLDSGQGLSDTPSEYRRGVRIRE